MLLIFLLFVAAVGLEALTHRPFLATRFGVVFAFVLGGERLAGDLYEVPQLPAVGFVAAAQTWGEAVLVIPGVLGRPGAAKLLGHEACHVAQYRRYTSFGFWLLYLGQWLRGLATTRNAFRAYWTMPLELEARAHAERSV